MWRRTQANRKPKPTVLARPDPGWIVIMSLIAVLSTYCATTGVTGSANGEERTWQRPTTIDEFFDGSFPRVIAHRGFSSEAPENTLAAIEKAIDVGADMVEFDVLLSRDGTVVVIHDEELERTTNGTGLVHDHDLEDLRQLDAGSWFGENSAGETFADEQIPTLDEVLEATRGRILVNIEIKTEAAETVPGPVAELLREFGMEDQAIVSSFNPRALELMRQVAPEIRRASLYDKRLHKVLSPTEVAAQVDAHAFSASRKLLTTRMLADARASGLPVSVYTVNRQRQMRRWIERGAAALFTDHPDVMIELVRP